MFLGPGCLCWDEVLLLPLTSGSSFSREHVTHFHELVSIRMLASFPGNYLYDLDTYHLRQAKLLAHEHIADGLSLS